MVDNQDSDKITPARVELTRAPPASDGSKRRRARFWLPALVLLVVAGAVLWYWLPGQVDPPAPRDVSPIAFSPRPLDESPYREAQLAQARREAQEVLSRVLEKQRFLENRGVTQWAAESFDAARNSASEGDELYRQRRFEQALARYRRADDQLGRLQQRAGQVRDEALAAGKDALEAGEASAAEEAFRRVLLIEPDHEQATAGLRRAENLPRVQSLLAQGDRARSAEQLEQARQHYAAAVEKDPEHEAAADRLAGIKEAIRDRDFKAAMSRGFEAFENSDADTAVAAFQKAVKLKPDNGDAASALRQAKRLETQLRLDKLMARARSLEDREHWREAETLYRQVRSADESLIEARVGALRAEARAELDAGLEKALSDPLRLGDSAVRDRAERLLADARGIPDPGPRLRRQIKELDEALVNARQPVNVTLQSDDRTRVTVLRVAELGTFETRELELRPGRYVALGEREGYRDVRVEFRVEGGNQPPITVICREPV